VLLTYIPDFNPQLWADQHLIISSKSSEI